MPGTAGAVLLAGHWGGLAWVLSPEEAAPLQAVQHPQPSAALCCAVTEDGALAATGGSDCSLLLWRVGAAGGRFVGDADGFCRLEGNRGALAGQSRARRSGRRDRSQWLLEASGWGEGAGEAALRCCGHAAPVTACALSAATGVALSGAADGGVLLHALRDGRCVRALNLPPSGADEDGVDALCGAPRSVTNGAAGVEAPRCGAVLACAIGPEGELVVHAAPPPVGPDGAEAAPGGRYLLCVYTLNGRPLAALQLRAPLLSLQVSLCGRWLVTCSGEGAQLLSLHTLEPLAEVSPPRDAGGATCAALSPCARVLLLGTEAGGLFGVVTEALLGLSPTE